MEQDFIDKITLFFLNPIMKLIEFIISGIFYNQITSVIVYLIFINIVALILMKKDKQYAKEEKYRIKERTLLITAIAGGSLGIYYGMYKYKHKTMHKKFTVLVPIIMLIQFSYLSYLIFSSIASYLYK